MKNAASPRPPVGQTLLEDVVIEDFLDGQPRANQWREMRETLQVRLNDAKAARDKAAPESRERMASEKKVRELKAQVAALMTEEAVTQFVEDSVRASLSRPRHASRFADESDDDGDEMGAF